MKSKKITKLKEITEEYKKRGIENPERAAAMYLKGFITAKKFSVKKGPLLNDERIEQLYNQFFIPEQEDHYKNVPPIVGGE
jgi:hypothetical protein|tara:strand:- start:241 stop:483 length:243 start_codon:yes stop_codon:yes gene_type:complete